MDREDYEAIKQGRESGDFNPYDASGGNFDDAFELGYEFAVAEAKYENEGE